MTVLRSRAALLDASEQDLRDTYCAMTGEAPPPYADIVALRTRTDMALMAAADAAGHLGVPRGAKPQPMTQHELRVKRRALGIADPHGVLDDDDDHPDEHPDEEGANNMARKKTADTAAPAPAKKAAAKKAAPAADERSARGQAMTLTWKLGTGEATSTVRPASRRGRILEFLAGQPGKKATAQAIQDHIGETTVIGDLRVLQKYSHIEQVA